MTIFNARAVMIYLRHEIALILAVPLIAVFVPACGWVEDGAGKKPRLLP